MRKERDRNPEKRRTDARRYRPRQIKTARLYINSNKPVAMCELEKISAAEAWTPAHASASALSRLAHIAARLNETAAAAEIQQLLARISEGRRTAPDFLP
jgi:hypothetical protein